MRPMRRISRATGASVSATLEGTPKMVRLTALLICLVGAASAVSHGNQPTADEQFPELKYLNWSVNPCDNFYQFTCGNFGKVHPLPPGKIQWDYFSILQAQIDEITNEILAAGKRESDAGAVRKAKDMYAACTNEDFNDFIAEKPMADVIDRLGGWPVIQPDYGHRYDVFSWPKVGTLVAEYGLNFLLDLQILPFWLDANVTMILVGPDTLALPAGIVGDPDIWVDDYLPSRGGPKFAAGSPYRRYLEQVALRLRDYLGTWADESFIRAAVEEFIAFCVLIKESSSGELGQEFVGTVPPTTVRELQAWSDGFGRHFRTRINWLKFFRRAFRGSRGHVTRDTKVYLSDMGAVAGVLRAVEAAPTAQALNFVTTRLVTYMAPDTSMHLWHEFNALNAALNLTVYPRWQYCVRKITSYPYIGMSLAVTHEYLKHHFAAGKLQAAHVLTGDLKAAFLGLLHTNGWMDDDSKQMARYKLSKMLMLIGFPDTASDARLLDDYYGGLRVCRYDHAGNVHRLRVFNLAKNFRLIGRPRDRTLWSQSPLYANAFYNQLNNRMMIPAGIMNPPFFTGDGSVVDYARIGAIIGHEITHGFDNKGKNTDADGSIAVHTWSNETLQAFDRKADCFLRQYSKYRIDEIDQFVNGANTLSENIADNGGLREAYYAFQSMCARQHVDTIHNFTKEQLFFVAYGTMWCKDDTAAALEMMSQKDVHAPNRFRVIGTVSNMAEFSQAFGCPAGSSMNPTDKCILW